MQVATRSRNPHLKGWWVIAARPHHEISIPNVQPGERITSKRCDTARSSLTVLVNMTSRTLHQQPSLMKMGN